MNALTQSKPAWLVLGPQVAGFEVTRDNSPDRRAPREGGGVRLFIIMSIDKNSSGLPEVNIHKRTTKVNLGVIVGVLVFLVITISMVFWFSANR